MPRIDYGRVRSLKDVIGADNYELRFGTIPGYSGNTSTLAIKCQQVSYPGMGIEQMQIIIHGHPTNWTGRRTFPGILSATFLEESDFSTSNAMSNWAEFVRGTESGNAGGTKREYAVDNVELGVFDATGREINTVTFFGFFIQEKPDVQLDGTNSSSPYLVTCTFLYDYFTDTGRRLR